MVVIETLMLTGFVSAVISISLNKLKDVVTEEVEKVKKLEKKLNGLATAVKTVELKVAQLDDEYSENGSIKKWAQNIIELCYIVDDIIDEANLEVMRLEYQKMRSVANESSVGLSSSIFRWLSRRSSSSLKIISPAMKKWKVGQKISEIRKEVDEIDKLLNSACKKASNGQSSSQPPPTDTDRLVPSQRVHMPSGRKKEKEDIINYLLNIIPGRSRDSCGGGISIVGMAGLGKTLLAHSILSDDRIRIRFKVIKQVSAPKSWSSIQELSITTVSSSLNEVTCQQSSSLGSGSGSSSSLLLLDNVREVKLRDWQVLKPNLVGTEPTVLLITTQDPEVPNITETKRHRLQPLLDKECEEIIRNTVSPVINGYGRTVLENKVECIAKKCSGLPLVADFISHSLRIKCQSNPNDPTEAIEEFEEKDFWTIKDFYEQVLPRLRFDQNIPKKLIKFLAYLALFPPTHAFKEDELLQLWRAEGLMKDREDEWTSSRPADNYFDSLVSRSILHSAGSSPKECAASATYRIHTFAHRFAQTVACTTYFRMDQGKPLLRDTYIYHFSSCCEKVEKQHLDEIEIFYARLRTFLLHSNYKTEIKKDPYSLFKKLKYLRVLSLSGSDIKNLPTTIQNLKHLRYLDVSYTPITRLPEEVCTLFGLQVLKLKPCHKQFCLPENICNLVNLIHLDLDLQKLKSSPANLGRLINLQTLPLLPVGGGLRISELENMNSIQGSIRITNLENVISALEAKNSNLKQKKNISVLDLEWTVKPRQEVAEDILTCLEPSEKLKELKISHYNGTKFPTWMSALKDLKSIYLNDCPECLELPPLGNLRLLRELKLKNLSKVVTVRRSLFKGPEHKDYPALEHLEILEMKELTRWIHVHATDMPILGKLVVEDCPKLVSLPMVSRPSLRNGLKIANCVGLQRHI